MIISFWRPLFSTVAATIGASPLEESLTSSEARILEMVAGNLHEEEEAEYFSAMPSESARSMAVRRSCS